MIGAGALLAGAALAQPIPQVRAPVTLPASSAQISQQLQDSLQNRPRSQRFPASITGSFTAPPLTAAITGHKLTVLRGMGLTVQASNLGAPTYFSPMRHTIDSSTYMAFSGAAPTLALPPATTLQGAVTIPWGTIVELNFLSASPFAYHLVECAFEGAQIREFLHTSGLPASDYRRAQPAGGRFAALITPNPTAARQLAFIGNDFDGMRSYRSSYVLAGCEVTPVNP